MEERPPFDDPLYPPPEPGEDGGLRGSIADGVKKALLAGVGALFLTEEGARRVARDWKLPKDVASFIGQQAASAKDDLLRVFAEEIRRFLESESVRREFWKGLAGNAIEIKAEIRFRSGEGPLQPEVTASLKRKPRARKKGAR